MLSKPNTAVMLILNCKIQIHVDVHTQVKWTVEAYIGVKNNKVKQNLMFLGCTKAF